MKNYNRVTGVIFTVIVFLFIFNNPLSYEVTKLFSYFILHHYLFSVVLVLYLLYEIHISKVIIKNIQKEIFKAVAFIISFTFFSILFSDFIVIEKNKIADIKTSMPSFIGRQGSGGYPIFTKKYTFYARDQLFYKYTGLVTIYSVKYRTLDKNYVICIDNNKCSNLKYSSHSYIEKTYLNKK
jgi:hypothetical protein